MSKQEDVEHMEKYVLSTGIRVGTQVKTKFMTPFVTKATNEGLYIIDSKKHYPEFKQLLNSSTEQTLQKF